MSSPTATSSGDVCRSAAALQLDATSDETRSSLVPTNIKVAAKPVIATDGVAKSTDVQKTTTPDSNDLEPGDWIHQADHWLLRRVQWSRVQWSRGHLLLLLLDMALFGFVAGVDIYTGLWAGPGFISTAAWASLGVSTVAFLIYIVTMLIEWEYKTVIASRLLVGVVWGPIEIALKASSLRLLNAADSGGATYKIRILFGLDLAPFVVLAVLGTSLLVFIIYDSVFPAPQERGGGQGAE